MKKGTIQAGEFVNVLRVGDVELGFYRGWLERLREQPPALEKRPTIHRALDFANTGSRRAYAAIMRGVALPYDVSLYPVDRERELFKDALAAIVEKRAVLALLKASWVSLANQLLPVPTYRVAGNVLRAETRYQQIEASVPMSGRLATVLMWLVDPAELIDPAAKSSDSFGARLCRCHYSECGRFFLARPPDRHGNWRRMYCPKPSDSSQDHMKLAHNRRKRPGRSGSKHK